MVEEERCRLALSLIDCEDLNADSRILANIEFEEELRLSCEEFEISCNFVVDGWLFTVLVVEKLLEGSELEELREEVAEVGR